MPLITSYILLSKGKKKTMNLLFVLFIFISLLYEMNEDSENFF